MSLAEYAVGYAEQGWEVLPCRPTGDRAKTPHLVHGFHDATSDTGTVEEWWTIWPDALIGLVVPSQLVIIDVDAKTVCPTRGTNGLEHFAGLVPRGERPPVPHLDENDPCNLNTYRVVSGRGDGGFHLYYLTGFGADHFRGQLDGHPGIDIKKPRRGYVIAPPSPHPATGRPYVAHDFPYLLLPDWLLRAARVEPVTYLADRRQRPSGKATLDHLVGFYLADAHEGSRNNQLFEKACRALEEGHGNEGLEALGRAALSVGLAEAEVRATLLSAQRKARQQQT